MEDEEYTPVEEIDVGDVIEPFGMRVTVKSVYKTADEIKLRFEDDPKAEHHLLDMTCTRGMSIKISK